MMQAMSVEQFLERLASDAPTPGGGSAAAVLGAIGAGLVSMVCNLTIGKPAYRDVEAEIERLLAASEALRGRFMALVNDDIEAFERVMAAYRMPRETDAAKAARSEAIQAALEQATLAPLACARASAELIELGETAAEKGNRNVVSDVGVGIEAARAALKSAALNVYVNTGAIKDEAFVRAKLAELEALLERAGTRADAIYASVKARL